MRFSFSIILLFVSVALSAQLYPPADFFIPYKYPKHYSFDGAFRIVEFNAILAKGNAGNGSNVKIDFATIKLGTPALRLNFGFGFGYTKASTKKTFAPTPLVNGTLGENYVTDKFSVPALQLYPRLWIRILNPLNFSVTGGPSFYIRTNTTTGHYSMYDYIFQENEQVIEKIAKSSTVGISFFIEAKAMLNFRNWGVSGGLSKQYIGYSHSWQPSVGLWFGLKQLEPVVN